MDNIYLVLSNGTIFEGESFGADVETVGELVFNTSMIGYPEILTDNNYKGQIVVQTFPMIGNYGMVFDGEEKAPAVSALIVREACETPSNFRCGGKLSDYLKKHGIPAICGVDTREITRILRENGTMNAAICKNIPENFEMLKSYRIETPAKDISSKEVNIYGKGGKLKVALLDLGTTEASVSTLTEFGCEVAVFPYGTCEKEIIKYAPCGVFISDGPGDPSKLLEAIGCVKALLGKFPIFATGMGHAVLALAFGCKTEKLKYGHRGSNQPCVHKASNNTYITNQNHGYAVSTGSFPKGADIMFINANDETCEGMEYPSINSFSVQFRPEAYRGPRDTMFLFKKFISNMEDTVCR